MPPTHAQASPPGVPTSTLDARPIAHLGRRIAALPLEPATLGRAFSLTLRALWDVAVLDRVLLLARATLLGDGAAASLLEPALRLAGSRASTWARGPTRPRERAEGPCKPVHLVSPTELSTLFAAADRIAALRGLPSRELWIGALELWSRAAPAEQLVHAAGESPGKGRDPLERLLDEAIRALPWGEGGSLFPREGDAGFPWPTETGNPMQDPSRPGRGLPFPEVDGPPWPETGSLPRPKWPEHPRDGVFPLDSCEVLRRDCEMDVLGVLDDFRPLPSSVWGGKIDRITPSAACPGRSLSLHGSGFGASQPPNVIVLIGELPATVTSWSDTRVIVVVPPGARSGTVGFRDLSREAERARVFEDNQRSLGDLGDGLACLGPARRFPTSVYQPAPVPANAAAFFEGTVPEIDFFRANGQSGLLVVRPGEQVVLTWRVRNATGISVRPLSSVGPQATTRNAAVHLLALGAFTETATVEAVYRIEANNGCGTVTEDIRVRLDVSPRLRILGVEVTQSIQRFALHAPSPRNTERLTAGKATMVRLYVESGIPAGFDRGAGPGIVENVTGSLLLEQVDGPMRRTVGPVGPDLAAPALTAIDRADLRTSLEIILPASLATGTQRIEARAWVRGDDEQAAAPEVATVTFHEMPNLQLIMVRVADPGRGIPAPSVSTYTFTLGEALGRLPFGEDSAVILLAPGYEVLSVPYDLATEEGWHQLLDDLDDIASDFDDVGEVWAAMTPDDPSYNLNGMATDGTVEYWFDGARRFATRASMPATFGHELAHTFGVGHAPCGDVSGVDGRLPGDTEEVGVDVRWHRALPAGTPELMSYCRPASGDFQDRWPSIALWDILSRR